MLSSNRDPDCPVCRCDELTEQLRAVLAGRDGHVAAGALAYELAATCARNAPTQQQAVDVLQVFYGVGVEQINAFWPSPHP